MSVNAIVGKLNKQVLDKAISKSDDMSKNASKGTSFKEMLSNVDSGADFANMIGIGGNGSVKPTSQMKAIDGENIDFHMGKNELSVGKSDGGKKVLNLLGEVNKGQMQMNNLVNNILYSGKRFSNQELLVIQAHVFHFAQMTELTVKVAEQGVSSVKSVLNTQVQ